MVTSERELRARGLIKEYGGRRVVDHVSLRIASGQVIGLLGPNGAGKTTTFYMITGLIRPDEGAVFLDEQDISELPVYLRARLGISYLPQETSVFRKLTVAQNVMAILETIETDKSRRQERLEELLSELDISSLRHQRAENLSGGQKRRLEITRALVTKPVFMLLDEPFSGLDPIVVLEIQKIILKLKESGIGIVITDHNTRETLGVCDKVYLLDKGRILEEGTPEVIASSERAKAVYLGKKFSM
ncbi:MAG: LPS export ABC transporter ATP-binding protein [Deltaproteobacteria bacterium]|nr:LPS export ABC transporter ATP-binding protein [Deltaproteobacteria bacterium]